MSGDTVSSLAQKLRPYWLRDVGTAGGMITAGGGAMIAHALSGAYHTGTLAESQAPWAVTDTELASHAENPDAHHARATAGTLISISGQQVSVANGSAQYQVPVTGASPFTPAYTALSSFAGDGMSFTGGKYVVGQGAGLTVSSTTVALTTPGTLSVSSANAAAGNHTHAITSSSNPGAAASLLATTAAGLLTLKTLDVNDYLYVDGTLDFGADTMYEDATYLRVEGSKDLRFAPTVRGPSWSMTAAGALTAATGNFSGDLYAAASGFRVINHTHDYPHSHVVINPTGGWTLDEQFGLDVDDNLLVRGYIVGKHALQVKDALMIVHYDGPEQGNGGSAIGHMGQPATITGDVVYRPGRFGKAVEVTSSYTNLVSNPSFEAGVTGWSSYSTGTAAGSRARTQEEAWDGYYSYRMSKTGGASADRYGVSFAYSVTSGQAYSLSVRIKLIDVTASAGNVVTFRTETNVDAQFTTYSTPDNEWVELTLTTTGTATGTATAYIWLANCATATVYVDALQVTATGAQRPFWAGGARADGMVAYSNIPVSWNRCTVQAWFRLTATAPNLGRNLRIFELRYDGANRYNVHVTQAANALAAYLAGGGGNVSPTGSTVLSVGAWYYAALVVDGTAVRIYLNGQLEASATLTTSATGTATVYVGSISTGEQLNGLIDDFAVINRALPADEIRAIYESNAPIFAETATWHWRAGRNRFWADAEGIWMLNAGGLPMFGAYAGDDLNPAATKTWGGVSLSSSDILMGDAGRGGYVLWDDSAAALEVKGTIKADAGYVGGWTIASGYLGATGIAMYSGGAFTARIELGGASAATTAGIRAGGDGTTGDTALWAGSTHTDTGNATWRVTLGGTMYAANAYVTGEIKATTGYIGGTTSGWAISSNTIAATNLRLVSGGIGTARIELGSYAVTDTGDPLYGMVGGLLAGSAGSNTFFWAGKVLAERTSAPFRVTLAGAVTATSGTIGGWTLGTSSLTSTGIGLYTGAAGTARLQVGSGASGAGIISPASGLDTAIWAGADYGDRGSAKFHVQADGTVWADQAILTRAAISNTDVSEIFAGNRAIRLGTDGQRFLLPNVTEQPSVPTSSSALRWFPTIDGTHDATKNYVGVVGYRYTKTSAPTLYSLDMLLTNFVGSTDAGTYSSRFILQAGHQTNSGDLGTYSDCRLEIVREAGAGERNINAFCNTLWVEGGLSAQAVTDRTPHFEGDALAALRGVKGKKGQIDHGTLPAFARRQVRRSDGETEEGRDLGAMISILVAAVGQLEERITAMKGDTWR